jgi:hypothetical protein
LAFKGRPKLAAATSPTEPQPGEPRRLTQSANRNTVENNMLCKRNKEQNLPHEEKPEIAVDISDRLIEIRANASRIRFTALLRESSKAQSQTTGQVIRLAIPLKEFPNNR